MIHSRTTLQKKIDDITIKINRLQAQRARERITFEKQSNTERRARTRTFIQLGELVNISGLLELFDICAGDDLELDPTKSDNGVTFLGCLMTVMEQMPPLISDDDKEVFKQKGIRALKMRNYEKREQPNTSHA